VAHGTGRQRAPAAVPLGAALQTSTCCLKNPEGSRSSNARIGAPTDAAVAAVALVNEALRACHAVALAILAVVCA